jgi:inner membrane protein
MPSPLGHTLGALAISWTLEPSAPERSHAWRRVAALAAIAVAPDLDLLIGRHSRETHSIGAAVIAASMIAWWWPALLSSQRRRTWLIAFLVWLSHPLLDILAPDGTAPFGVMLFWPVSVAHCTTGLHILDPINRRWWMGMEQFVLHNVFAIVRELLILGPIATVAWMYRRMRVRATRNGAPKTGAPYVRP